MNEDTLWPNGSRKNVKSVKHGFMFGFTEKVCGNDKDSVTRQKTALFKKNRNTPAFSHNRQAAMTVKSVGLAPAVILQLLQVCFGLATYFVRGTVQDVHRKLKHK